MEPNNQSHQGNEFLTNREMVSDMHTKVSKMYNVMYGDEDADIPGLSHRVKKLEESDKKRSGMYVLIAAISAGISLGIKAISEHFK